MKREEKTTTELADIRIHTSNTREKHAETRNRTGKKQTQIRKHAERNRKENGMEGIALGCNHFSINPGVLPPAIRWLSSATCFYWEILRDGWHLGSIGNGSGGGSRIGEFGELEPEVGVAEVLESWFADIDEDEEAELAPSFLLLHPYN